MKNSLYNSLEFAFIFAVIALQIFTRSGFHGMLFLIGGFLFSLFRGIYMMNNEKMFSRFSKLRRLITFIFSFLAVLFIWAAILHLPTFIPRNRVVYLIVINAPVVLYVYTVIAEWQDAKHIANDDILDVNEFKK